MSKKNLLLIFVLCLFVTGLIILTNIYFRKIQANTEPNMIESINNKALAAQSGQQAAVSELVDTIFAENSLDLLNPSLVASVKDRIVRAEVNGQTVSEAQAVQAFNWLADQYSAPAYAKTSPLQIRAMRVNASGVIPNLFVDKDSQGNLGVNRLLNSQLPSSMTPTQAVTLLILMVHQKVLNEYFQKIPTQWDADFLADIQSGNLNQQQGGGTPQAGFSGKLASQETEQMHQIVYGTSFSLTDQENIAQGALDQLGIPR